MASRANTADRIRRQRTTKHEGFLRHANLRWAKVAGIFAIVFLAIYLVDDPQPRPNGGTVYGYTLGTIGALLILWLTMLGVRKRAMTAGRWSLKAWTSAHVYLGLLLIVVGTLHTGFQFGWNIHTLAYVLMMFVIVSGMFGIYVYATLPQRLSDNRGETTQTQMLDNIRQLDRQLHDAAQPLDNRYAEMVQMSLADDPFGGGLGARLSGRYPRCGTTAALAQVRQHTGYKAATANEPLEKAHGLLERKLAMLERMRRHMRIKARLEIWLYVHIPVTFALIAALFAHIFSVFFYW